MQEKSNPNTISDQDLAAAFAKSNDMPQPGKHHKPKKDSAHRINLPLIALIVGCLGILGGATMLILSFIIAPKTKETFLFDDLNLTEQGTDNITYNALTGEALADGTTSNAPVYCIQVPNGTDGARPQAGLDQAGVVFEAIAEAGITRFAAIYQNPSSAIIGPIRSLRIYYLQWDTPFDCTIVHAGGSGDALAAVSQGYRDLTEDYTYMYRGTALGRRWNNLFTTSSYLRQFNANHGFESSNIKGFKRMTPTESEHSRIDTLAIEKLDIVHPTSKNTSELRPAVANISLSLGGWPDFNVNYTYDSASNKYLRSYASGQPHEIYACPGEDLGERNPEEACTLTQMAPSVVVALIVNERRASDNYHEDIDVIGSGNAYIFQNGTALEATWKKPSKDDQIVFLNSDGQEISLAPGQTFVTAVPSYGNVAF